MGKSLTYKILESHLVSGELKPGQEIAISVDQTLIQDATGTMACLQFEALGIPRVRTKLSVSYVDHNMLQTSFENADDHRFLQSFAAKYGLYFSRPGNGICHQVHLERFAVPGQTLLGSDSHTPMAGALGMVAIGAGGLDVAVAMGGGPYYFPAPQIVLVHLKGRLGPWVSGKDVILELLRRLSVKGGIGKALEYGGEGLASLGIFERATIANMGAELGATTSVFPSDERTREFMRLQKREKDWQPLAADPDAAYDEVIELDLSFLEPLIACPSSPDNVKEVSAVEGTKVAQVNVGSCNNSSYRDLATVAALMKGQTAHPEVSFTVTPGSRQVLMMVARTGVLADLVAAGARVLESACGPCIGLGQAPPSGGVSVRTFNRNFPGRSGTPNDLVYLTSPEVAAAAVLTGRITDPRKLGQPLQVTLPEEFIVDDSAIILPSDEPHRIEIVRGPNIKPLPTRGELEDTLRGQILLKVGDNITTDHILPAGVKVLPLRSNIPAISEYTFERLDPTFAPRARALGGGFVVGGANYGQGSSREHAALAPMYLGLKAVIAKSFARIHRANLINFGILPLTFRREEDYEAVQQGEEWEIRGVREALRQGRPLVVRNLTQAKDLEAAGQFTAREVEILLAGGLLNYVKSRWGPHPAGAIP